VPYSGSVLALQFTILSIYRAFILCGCHDVPLLCPTSRKSKPYLSRPPVLVICSPYMRTTLVALVLQIVLICVRALHAKSCAQRALCVRDARESLSFVVRIARVVTAFLFFLASSGAESLLTDSYSHVQ